ncbi:MAG: nodulation protein NfeD [Thermodesulfobacteriota bacterium]|nr:nodulation protein NfeD [Thermodesulfobacteriota bacterium]
MLRNRKKLCIVLLAIALLFVIGSSPSFGGDKNPVFDVITIDSAITPPVAKYIVQAIDRSSNEGSDGLIILLDTPGGLDLAMRDIIKGLLNSPVPVIVFVSPSGARAASAGVIITISAHVAAMAPGTNIGAAHPVALGAGKMDETMAEKVENDFVAYAKSIAEKRGRDTKWVEEAIRKSKSITAEEALKKNVIDFVAVDIKHLLEKLDGKEITLSSGKVVLKTKGAIVNYKKMGLRENILTALSNPNIAYLLLMIGLAGLYFEFAHPGVILPGVIGGISLILSFYALQTLPVNYAGVLLIIFGIILFIAEIKIISHGMLTVAGIISLTLGSIMLFESPAPALRVSFKVMIPTVAITSLFFAGIITLALKAQMRKPVTGTEGMIGEEGKTITAIHEDGKVFIKGEYWNAFSQKLVEEDERVKVIGISGLKVEVEEIRSEKEE